MSICGIGPVLAAGLFLIPMRGSESPRCRRVRLGTGLFLIPMRGSEHDIRLVQANASQVSDPHEG